jgi:multidrug resistance protein MdtO
MAPARTVTAMRHALAVILRDGAKLFRLPESAKQHAALPKDIDALRDQVGKTVRTMNDTVEYEFGVDRELHVHSSQTILRAVCGVTRGAETEPLDVVHLSPDRRPGA